MMIGRARSLRAIARIAVLVGLVTSFVGAPSTGAIASPATRQAPTWQLVDYGQKACFSPRVHDAYFGVFINGRWTRRINVGASGLPAGGSYSTNYAPIPPGSSNGVYSLASVHVALPTPPPIGTYTAWMWAGDGRSVQRVPIILDVRARCGNY
jgi:uncharacterized protein DUF5980